LFTRFKRSGVVLFLDPTNESRVEYDRTQKVNIVLSPALYWVKKIELPVKYVREVIKLLPSIFEDLLPDGNYSYSAYKSGDAFFVFAYEDKKILEHLSKNEINRADILSIHFAQSELSSIEQALSVNQTQSLILKEELLVLVPTVWLEEVKALDLSEVKLSKHKINLQQYSHIVDKKSLYKIGAMLVVLMLIIIAEIFITSQKVEEVTILKDELFSKYKLQQTMIQNRSTLSKYDKIHQTQTKLREYISYFLTIKLKKGQKITNLEYKKQTLYVSISGVTKMNLSKIKAQLSSKNLTMKESFSKSGVKMEIKL